MTTEELAKLGYAAYANRVPSWARPIEGPVDGSLLLDCWQAAATAIRDAVLEEMIAIANAQTCGGPTCTEECNECLVAAIRAAKHTAS